MQLSIFVVDLAPCVQNLFSWYFPQHFQILPAISDRQVHLIVRINGFAQVGSIDKRLTKSGNYQDRKQRNFFVGQRIDRMITIQKVFCHSDSSVQEEDNYLSYESFAVLC